MGGAPPIPVDPVQSVPVAVLQQTPMGRQGTLQSQQQQQLYAFAQCSNLCSRQI